MLDNIKSILPSGLTRLDIGAECWTQREEYPNIQRAKTIKTPPKPNKVGTTRQCASSSTRPPSLALQLLPHIDDMFTLYSNDMKADLERTFMDKVKIFVGSSPGRDLFTHDEVREIITYTSNKRRTPPNSFYMLCSFLLDASINVDCKSYTFKGITVTRSIDLLLDKK